MAGSFAGFCIGLLKLLTKLHFDFQDFRDMKRMNLVVVRAGDRSLHEQWLKGGERNWDLVVSYFGDRPELFAQQDVKVIPCRGSKWQGLISFLKGHPDITRQYSRIWFPDDDLLLDTLTINRFFNLSEKYDLALSQPALTWNSFYSHKLTLWHPLSEFRYTNFVEVMAPCFRSDFLEVVGESFGESSSGWGLEYLWAAELENRGFKQGIIDSTSMFHTRPVGSAGHGGANDPMNEMARLLEKYQLSRIRARTQKIVFFGIARPPLISDRRLAALRDWLQKRRAKQQPV